jgi:outer membrane receptor protein involved in Fe transport
MNSPRLLTPRLRRLVLAQACALLAIPLAHSQQAAKSAPDAKTLARYDTNKNGQLDANELAALQSDEAKAASAVSTKDADKDGVLTLSPFEVKAGDNGYMATNSASGTRLNSNLSDLASPISVVTKQQLQDMAAVDLNDIFRTETNVEGLYQYSEIGIDRNNVVDTVSNNPEANNRIRGIGQANITAGGMSVSNAVSMDAYNIDSVEISRGANSNIFGIGSTSGTVNLNVASGNMSREFTKGTIRVDSLGGYRGTFDFNRPIIRNKLAVRLLGEYGEKGFVREPSYDKDKRFTAAVRAQPFKSTSIKASYETVRQRQSLPNMLTPREQITAWRDAGAFTWDPASATVYNSAGQPVHFYTGIRNPTTGPNVGFGGDQLNSTYRFQGGSGSSDYQRPVMGYIDGQIAYFTSTSSWVWASRNSAGTNTYNQQGDQRLVDFQQVGVQIYVPEINPATGQPFGLLNSAFNEQLIAVHGDAGKAIYDWTKYNINASNRGQKAANTFRAELEQNIFGAPGEKQQLALQLGVLYEDIDNKSWNFIGNGGDGVQGIVYIDVNRTLPNGTVNPGYLRPYIRGRQPQRYDKPEDNHTHKGQLAYLLDLTKNEGWTRFLGRNNFLAYGEERERRFSPGSVRYRSQLMTGADGTIDRSTGNTDSLNTRYYLGDATGFNIDDPTTSPPTAGDIPYTYWSTEFGGSGSTQFDTAKFRNVKARVADVYFAIGTQKTEVRSEGGIWQGFFWNGRVVPTLGWRKDRVRFMSNKPFTSTYVIPGFPDVVQTDPNPTLFDFSDTYIVTNPRLGRNENSGQTRTQGIVLKPFQGLTRFSILNGLSLTYNRSASFDPAGLAIDTYGEILDNPTGKSEDIGIRFSLFNERLWISLNKYKAVTINARNGGANVVATRAIPFDVDTADSDPDTGFGNAGSPNQKDLFDWYFYRIFGDASLANNPTRTPAFVGGDLAYMQAKGLIGASSAETLQRVTDHVYGLMKYDKQIIRNRFNAPGAVSTASNDVTSQGYELEVLYRTKNWNLKLTGADKETIDSNVAGSLTRYIAERRPVLEAASFTNSAPGSVTESYWNGTFDSSGTTHGNSFLSEVMSVYTPLIANLGKPRPQIRKYSVSATSSYNLVGISDNKFLKNTRVGGNIGWVSKGSIGYGYKLPTRDPVTGTYTITDLDPSKPIYDKARYTASAWAAYDFRMFSGRIRSTLQLNVQNLLEDGRLQPVEARTDSQVRTYRIIDPRVYQLTWSFDL